MFEVVVPEVSRDGILTAECTVSVTVSVIVIVFFSVVVTVLLPTGMAVLVHSHSRAWASPASAGRARMTPECMSMISRVVVVGIGNIRVELVQAGF